MVNWLWSRSSSEATPPEAKTAHERVPVSGALSVCAPGFVRKKNPAVAGGVKRSPAFAGAFLLACLYLFFSALSLMAWPAADMSLPAPSVVLQALNAAPATISIATIAVAKPLRIIRSPLYLLLAVDGAPPSYPADACRQMTWNT
jgi:hypothetical protein